MKSFDRRSFLKGGAILASSAAVAGLAGCAPSASSSDKGGASGVELPIDLSLSDIECSSVELDPITEFADEQTYDIVVVGAGCAGVPAVLTAIEEGATVACLQKQGSVVANGYGASAVNKDASTPAGMLRWMEDWCAADDERVNRDLFRHHLDHSAETISWITQRGNELGVKMTYKTSGAVVYEDGEKSAVFEISASEGNTVLMEALAKKAEEQGAVFYYSTPAVQLVQAEDGTVTGVIGKKGDEYIKLNAEKAVILATGDYMNNDSLMNRYCRDVYKRYLYLQNDRTGDGQILGILAGLRIVPTPHPRQVHGVIPWFMKAPLIMLNSKGERFLNEQMKMTSWNSACTYAYPRDEEVVLYRFFDSEYETKLAAYQPLPPKAAILDPCIDEGKPTSEYDFHNVFHRADTLEALAEEVGLPADAVKKSIERYNELCAKGSDDDFGVEASAMKPIDAPPYYCCKDILGLAAIDAGFTVDNNYQATDADGNPIPHLYGAGVCADNVCGGIQWGMPGGFSNSHCFSSGRYTVIHALTGGNVPANPCTFDQVADYFRGEDGKFTWDNPETAPKGIDLW